MICEKKCLCYNPLEQVIQEHYNVFSHCFFKGVDHSQSNRSNKWRSPKFYKMEIFFPYIILEAFIWMNGWKACTRKKNILGTVPRSVAWKNTFLNIKRMGLDLDDYYVSLHWIWTGGNHNMKWNTCLHFLSMLTF